MNPLLISGIPGAGKTTFGQWLMANRGFVLVETDAEWESWGHLLGGDQSLEGAITLFNRAKALGPNVVFEWGFDPHLVGRVRQLQQVGFDSWWFGGDEAAARLSYIQRRGSSPAVMGPYENQMAAIRAFWPRIERLYGDRVLNVVSPGPTHMDPKLIAERVLGT